MSYKFIQITKLFFTKDLEPFWAVLCMVLVRMKEQMTTLFGEKMELYLYLQRGVPKRRTFHIWYI
ncbi:MAG: hypothetical protein CSB47_02415 [Proteobacteria bacterium]|nr:MAG: hypothetical protein CSB47_02415 [Pseudomonadota bacterium]